MLIFFNYGRTPANVIKATILADYLSHTPDYDYTGKIVSDANVGQYLNIMIIIGSDKPWESPTASARQSISSEILALFNEDKIFFYSWGSIEYRDVFGNIHHTYFCRRYNRRSGKFEIDGGFDRNKAT